MRKHIHANHRVVVAHYGQHDAPTEHEPPCFSGPLWPKRGTHNPLITLLWWPTMAQTRRPQNANHIAVVAHKAPIKN